MASHSVLFPSLLLLLTISLSSVTAQVPRVCAKNATQANGICCPPLPTDPAGAPCGGASRGSCQAVKVLINGTRQAVTGAVSDVYDTRMQWPIHLFHNVCQCSFFYSGYACQESHLKFGGPGGFNPFKSFFEPNKNNSRIRRDVGNLTQKERMHVRDVLVRAKEVTSEWVILNDTAGVNADGSKKITYFNVSVYDYYTFLNYYATRGVNINSAASTQPNAAPLPDLAHKGPNFVPWHRYVLDEFEQALDNISRSLTGADQPPFALPYWNWTDKTDCEACTDDLVGAINEDDPDGYLFSTSPFSLWEVLCDNEDSTWHPCDPKGKRPRLRRAYSSNPKFWELPTLKEVNATMNASQFDVEPFNEMANASSFRNLLEGYIGPDNNATAAAEGERWMGMKVRNFLNGTWTDLALGPNDPLFWLHQAFLNKIYEDWEAAADPNTDVTQMPANYVARPGEDRSDNLVPFLPPMAIGRALGQQKTFSNGYSYDTSVAKKSSEEAAAATSLTFTLLSLGFALFGLCAIVALYVFKRKRRLYQEVQTLTLEPISEKQPLLSPDNRRE